MKMSTDDLPQVPEWLDISQPEDLEYGDASVMVIDAIKRLGADATGVAIYQLLEGKLHIGAVFNTLEKLKKERQIEAWCFHEHFKVL